MVPVLPDTLVRASCHGHSTAALFELVAAIAQVVRERGGSRPGTVESWEDSAHVRQAYRWRATRGKVLPSPKLPPMSCATRGSVVCAAALRLMIRARCKPH